MTKQHHTPALPTTQIKSVRHLKISQILYEGRRRPEAFATSYERWVPHIRLKGCWLEQAGFNPDQYVTVKVMQGCLVITADEAIDDKANKQPDKPAKKSTKKK